MILIHKGIGIFIIGLVASLPMIGNYCQDKFALGFDPMDRPGALIKGATTSPPKKCFYASGFTSKDVCLLSINDCPVSGWIPPLFPCSSYTGQFDCTQSKVAPNFTSTPSSFYLADAQSQNCDPAKAKTQLYVCIDDPLGGWWCKLKGPYPPPCSSTWNLYPTADMYCDELP